ncbi:MAG: ImmA/IrrE family metallo-endopeptidase [Pirellulales bacterium]
MLPELAPEEFSHALDAVAAEVLALLPATDAPIDALELARALGLAVAWDQRQPGRGRIARLAGHSRTSAQGSILLRPEPRRERLQWAIAHEVGELCAYRVFERLAVDPREAPAAAREAVANRLASRLLLPRELFDRDGRRTGWDLLALKARYETASHELIARRMLDFGPSVIITIFDHGRSTFRRGNLPFRLPPLAELERAAWRVAHEQSLAVADGDFARRVQAWPVHEPLWKREILRTEWFAGDDADAGNY